MARFFTDFSRYPTGEPPYDWEYRWVLGGQTIEIVEDPDATGGKLLRHDVLEQERRAFVWVRAGRARDVDLVTRLRAHDPGARLGLVGRCAGVGPHRHNEDGFASEIEEGQMFTTRSYDRRYMPEPDREAHGTGQTYGSTSFAWEPGQWYWMRQRLVHHDDGVECFARVWTGDAADEPDTWDHHDRGLQPAYVGEDGFAGITGQRTKGPHDFDVFGVGVDGDIAPTS